MSTSGKKTTPKKEAISKKSVTKKMTANKKASTPTKKSYACRENAHIGAFSRYDLFIF